MTEGFVNKVKKYKRAIYGRAELDLLSLRVPLAVGPGRRRSAPRSPQSQER